MPIFLFERRQPTCHSFIAASEWKISWQHSNRKVGIMQGQLKGFLSMVSRWLMQILHIFEIVSAKDKILQKAVWARHRFSQKTNKRICFVCHEKQKSKQNNFVCSFFGRIYSATICFRFYLTFSDLKFFANSRPSNFFLNH